MKAVLGQTALTENAIYLQDKNPIIQTIKVATGQGDLVKGQVLAVKRVDGVRTGVICKKFTDDLTGDVNDTNKAFTYAGGGLNGEMRPRSVVITHGDQEVKDDGHGVLYGDGSGTVNYLTGAVSVTLDAAPASESGAPAVAWKGVPFGILTEDLDTSVAGAADDAGPVLRNGMAVAGNLQVADAAGDLEDLEADDIEALEELGVFVI